jgi:hypothetical protein
MRIELKQQIFRSPSGACPLFLQVHFENRIGRRDGISDDDLATLLHSRHKGETADDERTDGCERQSGKNGRFEVNLDAIHWVLFPLCSGRTR